MNWSRTLWETVYRNANSCISDPSILVDTQLGPYDLNKGPHP